MRSMMAASGTSISSTTSSLTPASFMASACGMVRGKAVEQEALGAIGLRQAFLHQADDDVVADQAASVHHLLGGHAQRCARLDGGAQHVAGGDLRDAVVAGR
jgi:hypothetical protein